jgi:hypothetical protein
MGVMVLEPLQPFLFHRMFRGFLQKLNLIICGLKVVRRRFLDLDCYVSIVLEIFGQPDGRKMPPAQLLDDNISVHQNFPNINRVIPSVLIVIDALVLRFSINVINNMFCFLLRPNNFLF